MSECILFAAQSAQRDLEFLQSGKAFIGGHKKPILFLLVNTLRLCEPLKNHTLVLQEIQNAFLKQG